MTPEQWKDKRQFKDTVSTESLQKVINDYENKLCEKHNEILFLNQNVKKLKEDLEREIKFRKYDTRKIKDLEKTNLILNSKVNHLIKFIRSKGYLRGTICKEFKESITTILYRN